jgi:hypothetical protein
MTTAAQPEGNDITTEHNGRVTTKALILPEGADTMGAAVETSPETPDGQMVNLEWFVSLPRPVNWPAAATGEDHLWRPSGLTVRIYFNRLSREPYVASAEIYGQQILEDGRLSEQVANDHQPWFKGTVLSA